MSKVVINGVELDMALVAMYMDEEIREDLHISQDWDSDQEFLDAYCKAHEAKYGEEFQV